MKHTHFFKNISQVLFAVLALSSVAACTSGDLSDSFLADDAQMADMTKTGTMLKNLPAPTAPIVLAVYKFDDKTGQQKPSENFPEYSRAVTQGGAAILSKALYDAGGGKWFTVLEREGLDSLIQERKIIRATRSEYATEDGTQLGDVGPMLYAGLLLEGGIISYESNIITGGAGASYLGVGADAKYRKDIVTVALRAVSVQTGQVVLSVNTSKTIFSTLVHGGINKFVAIDELLEAESGFSVNEPPQFAVRQAVELAVYSLVVEGAERGLWSFANANAGRKIIDSYRSIRNQNASLSDVEDNAAPNYAAEPRAIMPPPAPLASPAQPMPAPAPVAREALPPIVSQQPAEPRQPAEPVKNLLQLPADAKPKPNAAAPVLENETGQELQPYNQRGVVYCGPSGCMPAYEPPVGQ